MDTIFVVGAALMVANKYRMERNMKRESIQSDIIDYEVNEELDIAQDTDEDVTIEEYEEVGVANNPISGGLPFVPKSTNVDVATRRGDHADEEEYSAQFFPQNTASTGLSIPKKSWMLSVENSYNIPKTDRENAFPKKQDRDDIMDNRMSSVIRNRSHLNTRMTIHENKSKNHDVPIEPEMTGGGSRGGIFPVLERPRTFVLDTNPVINQPEPLPGAFSGGAKKSANFSATENRRSGMEIDRKGISSGVVTRQVQKPIVDPSAEDGYTLDKYNTSGFRNTAGFLNLEKSFTVSHDEEVDTFKNDIQIGKQKTTSLNPKVATQDNSDGVTLRDAEIETPSMVGAIGGTRLKTAFKDGKFSTSDKKEDLEEAMTNVKHGAGIASMNKSGKMIVEDTHEPLEETLAEQDDFRKSNVRKTNSSIKKSIDNSGEFEVNDNRESINEREFTSKNFVAPVSNSTLPISLRTNPTTSMSSSNVELKSDADRVVHQINTSKIVSHKMTRRTVEMDSTSQSARFSTILNDRLKKVSRKPGINPYIKRQMPAMEV